MEIDEDRRKGLDAFVVDAFWQLRSGYGIESIDDSLDILLLVDEREYIISEATRRYNAYYDMHREEGLKSGKMGMIWGISIIATVFILLLIFGDPAAPRLRSKEFIGFFAGVAIFAHGLWRFAHPDIDGRRMELKEKLPLSPDRQKALKEGL